MRTWPRRFWNFMTGTGVLSMPIYANVVIALAVVFSIYIGGAWIASRSDRVFAGNDLVAQQDGSIQKVVETVVMTVEVPAPTQEPQTIIKTVVVEVPAEEEAARPTTVPEAPAQGGGDPVDPVKAVNDRPDRPDSSEFEFLTYPDGKLIPGATRWLAEGESVGNGQPMAAPVVEDGQVVKVCQYDIPFGLQKALEEQADIAWLDDCTHISVLPGETFVMTISYADWDLPIGEVGKVALFNPYAQTRCNFEDGTFCTDRHSFVAWWINDDPERIATITVQYDYPDGQVYACTGYAAETGSADLVGTMTLEFRNPYPKDSGHIVRFGQGGAGPELNPKVLELFDLDLVGPMGAPCTPFSSIWTPEGQQTAPTATAQPTKESYPAP